MLVLLVGASVARAHEFWIMPNRFAVEPGAPIQASLNVGAMMHGSELPYLSRNLRAFTVSSASVVHTVEGMEGDLPALSYEPHESGLHIIAYQSTPSEVTFDDWGQFTAYLEYEGLDWIAAQHRARGLPEDGFRERYSRYAKSLVMVGDATDGTQDRAVGAPLELVADDNPYATGLDDITVTLLREGRPVPHHSIAVHRDDGAVSRQLIATDGHGRARISLAGGGAFLLNATDLQPIDDSEVVWESQWASLTFGIPVAQATAHPLDPLTPQEIARSMRIIGASGHANRDTRVALVGLAPPDKTTVLAWRPGTRIPRRAFAVVRNGDEVFEAHMNLDTNSLEKWRARPGVQPPITSSEWSRAQQLTKADPRWIAAMRARGYDDFDDIFCESLSVGYFGRAEERQRRLLKMPCYDIRQARSNVYGRPVEGLVSVVDLNRNEVVRVIDTGPVPVSRADHNFDKSPFDTAPKAPRTVRRQPPDGSDLSVDGRVFSWHGWSFHLGFDPRFGPVLSLVTHVDGQRRRSIMYEGHVSEVFVPYMDADEGWYYRTYMDAGEYGLGVLTSPLTTGLDCPEHAMFVDADLTTPTGAPYVRPRAICVFERAGSAPLWRHWEALNGTYSARATTELVVRSIPSVANYDYVIDWVFTLKGEIHVNLGATGIDAVKGVAAETMRDPEALPATRTGVLVAPNLLAVHHDHYFSLRLDLDVDGPINSFAREQLVAVELPATHPRRSLWDLIPVEMPTEGGVSARLGPELWRVENTNRSTALGHHPSFQIAGAGATSLLDPQDWAQRRAAFSAQTLWVTARHADERFASGPYPNQNTGEDGLPGYVDGESIRNTDLVVWYTLGFHHLTRPEDWPVLPTIWHSVRLRPYAFFDGNPSVSARFSSNPLPADN